MKKAKIIKGVVISPFKTKDKAYKVGDEFTSKSQRTMEILIKSKRIKI